jgi:hypothetical protein
MRDTKELKQYMKIYYQLCPRLPTENISQFVTKPPSLCIYLFVFS